MTTTKRSGSGAPAGVRRRSTARINGVEYIVDMRYRRIREARNPDGVYYFDQDDSRDDGAAVD
jgi:hypothetical protein